MNDLSLTADFSIEASADGASPSASKRFSMVAYTGAPIRLSGVRTPVIVDMTGLRIPSQSRPILLDHKTEVESVAGQSDALYIGNDGMLHAAGEIIPGSPRVDKVIELAGKGFKWQASIGARPTKTEELRAGAKAVVNGREVVGPMTIVREATLREISVVACGADDETMTVIAAQASHTHTQEQDQMPTDNAAAEQTPETINASAAPAATPAPATTPAAPAAPAEHGDVLASALTSLASAVGTINERLGKLELSAVRDERPRAPAAHIPASADFDVLEAAFARSCGLDVEAAYGEQTLDAAHRHYRSGVGLQELLLESARMGGYRGRSVVNDDTLPELINASFTTGSISGLLSAVANKKLIASFNAVDPAWRSIANVRSVSDLKPYPSYRLTTDLTIAPVGPGGELQHGTFGEMSYSNAAATYGRYLTITRTMWINDDLGALTQMQSQLGRGAAIGLNKVFWTEYLANNDTFYTTGRGNYFSGSSSNLSIDSLTTAERMFLEQTDPSGNPLSLMPSILIVPPSTFTLANTLMRSTEVRDTTASTKYPITNPHAGKFSVVTSPYLNNAAIPGGSATHFFLTTNPSELSTIEVAFLNGNETPIVEQAQVAPDKLGVAMRVYWDFGVSKQEYRATVKSKGAA